MELIETIDETIEEFKTLLEDKKLLYKANSFALSIDTSDYEKLQYIDVTTMIRNKILYYFIDEEFSKYKKLNEKLSQMHFDSFYKKYIEHHIPTTMEILEVKGRKDGSAYSTIAGKRAYHFLGIMDLYDDSKKEEERLKIVHDELIKQKEKSIADVFENQFLKKLLHTCEIEYSEEDLSVLQTSLYNICTEIFDAEIFTKRKNYLFVNCKKTEVEKVKSFYKSCCIVEDMRWIKKAYHKLIAMDKEDKKELQSTICALEKIKLYLQDKENLGKSMEKINFSALDEVDAMAYYSIFEEALLQQKKRYERLAQENQKNQEKDKNNMLEDRLKRHNIRFCILPSDIQELLLQCKNLEQLEKNIKALYIEEKNLLENEIAKFLIEASSKQISFYSYLIDNAYLCKNTLFTYLKNENMEENLRKNMDLLNNENISAVASNYNEMILLKENEELEQNRTLLDYYKKSKTENNFNYLFETAYYDILDFFIEHDMELSLLDNHILKEQEIQAFIKRVQICTALDIDIYTKSGNINRSFLLGKGFYCEEKDLDSYMLYSKLEDEGIRKKIRREKRNHINDEIFKMEAFKTLETYKREDELAYEIEGTFISRLKVMRNLTYFYENDMINENTILQSIIYNSNLNDEQIDKIKSVYQEKKKIKK